MERPFVIAAAQPSRPDRSGINVMPMSATPPPATSCLTPCDFAYV